jgi:glucose dehydrogenase
VLPQRGRGARLRVRAPLGPDLCLLRGGGHRPGDNLFSNSLVALDAATGERVWHFQMVHHDLWEYDTVGPATLGDITVDGRRIKAVMQPSKTGWVYVFDRETGEPVWPIEERPVPQSTVPGEYTSPTQPFPTKPPPFDRQGVTEEDLIDFTPELRAQALALADSLILAPIFTPPVLVSDAPEGKLGVFTSPGGWGAGNWNTGAFDPETGVYYAVSHTLPWVLGLAELTDSDTTLDYGYIYRGRSVRPRGRRARIDIEGLPIVKPPYGRITAIDMSRGEHLWMVANGDGPRDHPLIADLDLPPLGNANRPTPLVTKTLLFIGEGSDAIMGTPEGMWGTTFRALDKATGELIWETDLGAGTTGGPMTYLHNGKQYIVVAVGGRDHFPEFVALGLP